MSWPVTGMGAVASVGRTVDEIYAGLCAGHSGIGPLRAFNRDWYRGGDLFEVDDRAADGVDVPGRAGALLLDAVTQAVTDAGLDERLDDVPVLVGTGLRELRSVELWWRDGVPLGPGGLHFGTVLRERFGAVDTHTFANACSASLYALAMGVDLLELDLADTVIVAGVDVVTESMFGLADRVQPEPPGQVRPFDRHRRGTILGEGAAAIVLRRDATTRYGNVLDIGVNCDAYHPTAPALGSVAAAMRDAHRRAGVKPEDIDLVMLHGTGTPLNDEVEASALVEVYGDDVSRVLMTGVKSLTGHTSGASGMINLIVALRAMREGLVPPICGLDDPVDEAARFNFARPDAVRAEIALAQIDGFGFGGINAVAIVEAAEPWPAGAHHGAWA